jgi:hypothetical protein
LKVLRTGRKRDKEERKKKDYKAGKKEKKKLVMSMYCIFQSVATNTSRSVTKPSHRTHNR